MLRKILIGLGVLVVIALVWSDSIDILFGLGGILLAIFVIGLVITGPSLLVASLSNRSDNALRENRIQKNKEVRARLNIQALDEFGKSPEARTAAIDSLFDRRDGSITCEIDYLNAAVGTFTAELSRPLAGMKTRDREVLRSLYHLHNLGLSSDHDFYFQRLGIVWGDGAATAPAWKYEKLGDEVKSLADAVRRVQNGITLEPAIAAALQNLTTAIAKKPDDPVLRRLQAQVLGDGGDLAPGAPLMVADLASIPPGFLVLGSDQTDASKLWGFAGEGSLITVAPPGSGKTQCHVIPNLLTWRGPAIVLDIKGEIFAATSGWRAANVGPIYKFAPLDPSNSHAYNPLTAVSQHPDHIWEDARYVADMMIVPSGTKEPFWEQKARDILTAAIAYVAYGKPPEQRSMGDVLDILHSVGWDRFVISLQAAIDVPSMARAGRSLAEMEAKTRDGVLQSALANLSAWEGGRIDRATSRSDWRPGDFRAGQNPTLYICLNPNEIESYASLLRVVIAQHIRTLTATFPEPGSLPILFILDELPRLRRMPPIESALEIGRQYGLKLWLFAQSLGQLKAAYENADGMVGSCAVRMFMNASLHDGTAQKLSDDMGFRDSVIDGTRVKRVEPQVLGGAEFKDAIIVMASSAPPARLEKNLAHADPELSARMAMAPVRGQGEVPRNDG